MTDQVRLQRRVTFEAQAERYAARRPTYPQALFDRLASYGGLDADARVLEVGPGTGQATVSMAERGWAVTAVELGPELAATARRRLADQPRVEVVVGAFEEWAPPSRPDERFDAFVCATAFHWLDPATRLPRAVAALRPGGTVAVVHTHHVAGGTVDFFAEVQSRYVRWDPRARPDEAPADERTLPPDTAELLASPLVTDVSSHPFGVDLTYTRADYLELLRTYSNTSVLPPEARQGLLGDIGDLIESRYDGAVTKRYLFELVLARTR